MLVPDPYCPADPTKDQENPAGVGGRIQQRGKQQRGRQHGRKSGKTGTVGVKELPKMSPQTLTFMGEQVIIYYRICD